MQILVLACLGLAALIFIVVYINGDKEALVYSLFIIAAYFVFKLFAYIISEINYGDFSKIFMDETYKFLRYLTASLVFTLIMVSIFPSIKRRL